jgi:hypothetical protein
MGSKGFSMKPQKLLRYLGSSKEGFSNPTLISRLDMLDAPGKKIRENYIKNFHILAIQEIHMFCS